MLILNAYICSNFPLTFKIWCCTDNSGVIEKGQFSTRNCLGASYVQTSVIGFGSLKIV